MDRFLLAENPMKPGELAIIHTISPISIIEVIEDHVTVNGRFKHFIFKNAFDENEKITFRLHHLFFEGFNQGNADEIVEKLFDKAWRWYRSYLEWEDDQILTDDEI